MTAGERRRLVWVIALASLVLSLPYIWAALCIHPAMVYGGLLYNPDDQNVHLAWARQAAQGHFFFHDLFTTESLDNGECPLFSNIFCFALGILAALTHIPLVWLYQGARLGCAALALLCFYRLCALLTEDRHIRFVALLLVAFSSGAGWLQNVAPRLFANHIFIDRPDQPFPMMPEAFTFTSAYIFPLYIAAIALLAAIYGWTLQAQQTGRWRYAVGAGLASLLLGNIHTYDALPLATILLCWTLHSLLTRSRPHPHREVAPDIASNPQLLNPPHPIQWLAPLFVAGCALVPVALQWLVFRNSYEFSAKALTKTAPPPFIDVLLSYGPVLLLAVVGIIAAWRETRTRLMTLWVAVTFGFIYIPTTIFSFARKMIEGLHLPLCFLAATGLVWLARRVPSQLMQRVVISAVVLVSCISSGQFVLWSLNNAQDNNIARGGIMPPLYLTPGDAGALDFLAGQASSRQPQVVLCLVYLGNYVPRATGYFVYWGHWAETLNGGFKAGQVTAFYSGQMAGDTARAFLRDNHISYVLEGAYEKAYSSQSGAPSPSQRLRLTKVYEKAGTKVYKVP